MEFSWVIMVAGAILATILVLVMKHRWKGEAYHDPLDQSLLTDPVDLKIGRLGIGEIVLKVNRGNRDRYLRYGPAAFTALNMADAAKQVGKKYMVRTPSVSGGDIDGFDIVDVALLYELIFSGQGYVADDAWSGGQGGEFGGAGATGDFGSGTGDAEAANALAADPAAEDEKDDQGGQESDDSQTEDSQTDDSDTDDSGGDDADSDDSGADDSGGDDSSDFGSSDS